MKHTLSEMRRLVQELLHDLHEHTYQSGRLNTFINLAYQDVVKVYAGVAQAKSVFSNVLDIAIKDDQREYELGRPAEGGASFAEDISRVVDVKQVDSNGREREVAWQSFERRDDAVRSRSGVYLYRKVAGQVSGIVLGLVDWPSVAYQTLRVWWVRVPAKVTQDNHSFPHIPAEHHEVIGARAAWWLKFVDNQDARQMLAAYQELVRVMTEAESTGLRHASGRVNL